MPHPNDPSLRSFIPVAATSDFPIQNLPFGVFRPGGGGDKLPRRHGQLEVRAAADVLHDDPRVGRDYGPRRNALADRVLQIRQIALRELLVLNQELQHRRERSIEVAVLAERFRQLLGVSTMAYLTRARMQLGAQLLTSTRQPVAQIAVAVMGNVIRSHFGTSKFASIRIRRSFLGLGIFASA